MSPHKTHLNRSMYRAPDRRVNTHKSSPSDIPAWLEIGYGVDVRFARDSSSIRNAVSAWVTISAKPNIDPATQAYES